MEMYKETGIKGLDLWDDLLTAFRPHTIRSWTRTEEGRWVALLRANGVHVDYDRAFLKTELLVRVLYRTHHIAPLADRTAQASPTVPPAVPEHPTANQQSGTGSQPLPPNNNDTGEPNQATSGPRNGTTSTSTHNPDTTTPARQTTLQQNTYDTGSDGRPMGINGLIKA